MKRSIKITVCTAVLLIVINLIPFKTGPTVGGYCGMEYHKQTLTVLGVPFGYLQNTTHTGCGFSLLKQGRNVFRVSERDGTGYDNYHFKVSAFLEDALLGLIVLALVYTITRRLLKSERNIQNRRRF